MVDAQLATVATHRATPAASFSPNLVDHLGGGPGHENRFLFTPDSVKKLCKQGQVKGAVEGLEALARTSSGGDLKFLLYSVLKECVASKELVLGGQVHALARRLGFGADTFLCNHFIRMYAGHGKLREAMDVFRGVAVPDSFMWSSMISAYAKQGQALRAIELYRIMRAMESEPDNHVFVATLHACAAAGDLRSGQQLHSQIKERGLECDTVVGGSLVNMYAKCGSLVDARTVFDGLGEKSVVTWTAMIAGYAKVEGKGQDALTLYGAMHDEGMAVPNTLTFVRLLQACASVGGSALEQGKQLHAHLKERGLESDVVVGGSLVNMYAKCGSLEDARIVFDGLRQKSVVTWTAMIAGYAKVEGMGQEALNIYSAMRCQGMHMVAMAVPNTVTFVCLLQACANVGVSALELGKQLHVQIKERGLESDVVVGGSLVNMYAKCGSLVDARTVFDGLSGKSVVTWTAMIAGYANEEGMGQEALNIYSAMMRDAEGVVAMPNTVTFVCVLQACANVGVSALEKGKQVHAQIKERGLESDVGVGCSLVNMYAKCGSLADARTVFDGLGDKSVVTWNAMIAGYAQQEGMGQEALNIYSAMRREEEEKGSSVTPNAVTYACLLEACGNVGALRQGQDLHAEICEGGFESSALVGPCLVKMYAQCGRLEVSREVFDRLPVKSVEAWSALINGYAEHGEGGMAIRCFEEQVEQGVQPNEVTYVCLLAACSRAGLVDDGQRYFDTMEERHGIKPDERHYNCMVDLLGRAGHLDRAEQMLLQQSSSSSASLVGGSGGSVVSWTALLSACKSHGNTDLGRRCFKHLVDRHSKSASAYLLLGSIYANAGRWDEVARVEGLRKAAGAGKKAATACIEVNKEVREFTVGEERCGDLAASLRRVSASVQQEGGHVPQTQLVLRPNVCERDKEDALCGHAEKLALAYGLLNTPAGAPLVVTKNLRMCGDCHSSTKIMSRLEKRDIVVRDGYRVHRFDNGACSCQDKP